MTVRQSSIAGCLLGVAVGDALGLPYEGLTRRRAARLLGPPERHRFLWGRGMVSDDTEHACLTAQALISAADDCDDFSRQLASRMRRWLLTVPAGIGLATLRASLKLCLGVSPDRSGVFSAGNGPAMRSVLLGSAIEDPSLLRAMVRVATRITHTDPKAEYGALAIAFASRTASEGERRPFERFTQSMKEALSENSAMELLESIERVRASLDREETTQQFAASIGLERGVTGYIYHTVPVILHAWGRSPSDYRAAVTEVIQCGGDTDTTAAILGGIVGSGVGLSGLPVDWRNGLCDWPRTAAWIERLASQLAEARQRGTPAQPLRLPALAVLARNAAFAAVVLGHGFRRLLPPY